MREKLVKEIEASYPEHEEPPPLDETWPSVTSWSHFKEQTDAKRAKEPATEM